MRFDIKNKNLVLLESKTEKRRHISQESVNVYQVLNTPYKLQVTVHTTGAACVKIFGLDLMPEYLDFASMADFRNWQKSEGITIL